MMGSILYQVSFSKTHIKTYYNPMIVRIFRYFCGVRLAQELELDRELGLGTQSLCYIAVPLHLIGESFGTLFEELTLKFGVLPIGIFRDEMNADLGNRLSFVYTNPLSSLLLKSSDLVYVLSSENQLS